MTAPGEERDYEKAEAIVYDMVQQLSNKEPGKIVKLDELTMPFAKALAAEREAERERCAKIVDALMANVSAGKIPDSPQEMWIMDAVAKILGNVAAAIRGGRDA